MKREISELKDELAVRIYHVMNRGNGKQIIFEQKRDYEYFIETLAELKNEMRFDVLAYCLMKNHFHLLLRINKDHLPDLMQRLSTSYARYYNTKYEHAGHVFQGPYKPNLVYDNRYLEACVRYIHNNPVEAGLCERGNYYWSSYRDFIRGKNGLADVEKTLELLGGMAAFREISQAADEKYKDYKFSDCVDVDKNLEKGLRIISAELGRKVETGDCIKALDKPERNRIINKLKTANLSHKEIELLTGISKYIISRA